MLREKTDRHFASESELRRYSEGYDRGLRESAEWHPYMMWDIIWATGYRDAHRDFPVA